MQTLSILRKADLVSHEGAIEELFLECFADRMSKDIWRWAYLDNPHGEPFVSLCYDGQRLVGHYAIIPLPIVSSQARLNTYLSMTTMVAASHRQHGLFVLLAENTYRHACEAGVDFVMGFPNAASTPGFGKRLKWDLPEPDYVASLSKAELLQAARDLDLDSLGKYGLDLNDEATRQWRLSRPGATYQWRQGLAYKEYGDTLDLIWFDRAERLSALPEGRKVNLLLPASVGALKAHKVFDYQFGGRSLAGSFAPSVITRQMALSDVF